MASKHENLNEPITAEQFKDLENCKNDPFIFSKNIKVINPMHGKVSFDLYPYQKRVLWHFLNDRFNIILKFRQAGITELISLYSLWLGMYHPNKTIVIISIKDRVAKKVLRKIKYMYKNLPNHLKIKIVNGRTGEFGTATDIEFSNGSIISSVPTTEDAGRSEAVSLLVIDEAAIVRWANQIWAAAFPTLSTGGSSIVNSCVTGDTKIIGKNGNFRVDSVAPKDFGKHNIEHLDLKVLSHNGIWQKVIGAVNKGQLETWEIRNKDNKILKCTPNHKLLTPHGWRTVKQVLSKNLSVINYSTGIENILEPPKTNPPNKEIIKEIPGFPNYRLSNMGKLYIYKGGDLIEKEPLKSNVGYSRVSLHHKGRKKKYSLSRLVTTLFIGDIPEGYVVDHINCKPEHNYVTNLQIITHKENAQRAIKYSRGLCINNNTGKGSSNLQLVGYIKMLANYAPDKIIAKVFKKFGQKITRVYISRILNGKRNTGITISKITLEKKYIDKIYDLSVENDSSYITDSQYVNHNTPYGVGNWFHKQWVDAVSGGNNFNAIRLRWNMHPERDQLWYDQMADSLGKRRTAQEIDGDFLTSGHSVFDLDDIKAIEDLLFEQQVIDSRFNGQLKIFEKPQKGQHYYIGADISTGRSQDYSAFSIMDRNGEEVGCFKGKISVDRFAKLLMEYGYKYNNATLAPEGNDIGLAVVKLIQADNYPNLYYSTKLLRKKGKKRAETEDIPGWLTTSKNRTVIIDELEQDIRNEEVYVRDPFFVQEAYTFIYDASNRPVALGKGKNKGDEEDETYTDDSIMAKAITNFIRKGKQKTLIVSPR